MNRTIWLTAILGLSLFCLAIVPASALAEQQKKPRRPGKSKTPEPASLIVGKELHITRTDGSQIVGKFVSIDMQKVVYENSANEKIPIPLESVSILMIGEPPKPQIDEKFINDADGALSVIDRLAIAVDADADKGLTYREYSQKVTEAKVAVESFIAKYSDYSDQKSLFEAMRTIIKNYEVVSPIWAMRIGADQRRSIGEESPELQAVLALFPELKTTVYNRDGRYPTDKVVAWVWSKTAPQVRALKVQVRNLGRSKEGN